MQIRPLNLSRTNAAASIDARASLVFPSVVYPPVHLLRWANGRIGNIRFDNDGWSFAVDGDDSVRSIHGSLSAAIVDAQECGAEYFNR